MSNLDCEDRRRGSARESLYMGLVVGAFAVKRSSQAEFLAE